MTNLKPGDLVKLDINRYTKNSVEEQGYGIYLGREPGRVGPSAGYIVYWLLGCHWNKIKFRYITYIRPVKVYDV